MRAPRRRTRLGSVRGFTLVELVVALTILGVLSALLVNGLRVATGAWDTVEQRTTSAHQEHLTLAFLQRQLELAQPMRLFRKADQKEISFVGEPHAVRFVAPLPGHLGAGGMYWFTVELVDSVEGKRLVVSYQLFQREEWESYGAPEKEQLVLIDGLADAEFAYLEPARDEHPARWTTAWEPQEQLPDLIRLRFADQSGAEGQRPDFFVAPKLAAYHPTPDPKRQ